MAASSDDEGSWLDPKWFVAGFALVIFSLILTYDLRLGIAVGVLFGVIGAFWLYVTLRYGSLSREPASGRKALVKRFQSQTSNRRRAAVQTAENEALSVPEQRSDPTQRP